MAEPERLGAVDYLWLLIVLALAAGARAWYVGIVADNGTSAGPLAVQRVTDGAGDPQPAPDREIAAGTGGLYPWLLARLNDACGDPAVARQATRWIQCALGALTAVLYSLFALRGFRSRLVGVLAGLLCAGYPFWVVNTTELSDGVLASFLLATGLFLGARGSRSGGALTSWFYGLALAGLAVVRVALLPFALVAELWFLWRCRTLPRGWLYAVLAFLGCATGLSPWVWQNFQDLRASSPVVDAAYLHLWIGNNPGTSNGPAVRAAAEKAPPTNRERARAVWHEVMDNPAGTIQRRLWAGLDFFFGEEWFQHGRLWRPVPASAGGSEPPGWFDQSHAAILSGALLAMFVLGIFGWRWSYGWREALPAALAVALLPLPYLLSHAAALHGPRLPLDGVFLCYAAFALACLISPAGKIAVDGENRSAVV
ncbi:MAG TPA: hypothetical protein VG013_22490 [Gemmataceae bacterium]|jgi:hypothetical protein|nr:hypothetical protein [Gemmataceae bacterium]